MTQPRG